MRWESDADLGWVGALTGRGGAACRRALGEAEGERRLFAHLVQEHEAEGRESYVEIDAPFELYALTRLLRPRHIVEVGVSSGVSSAYLLSALARNRHGTLHSVDRPSRPRRTGSPASGPRSSWSLPMGRSSGWAVPMPLRTRWDLRIGDKADVLPSLSDELPRIDLIVYDVPHEDRTTGRELRAIDPRIPPGGVVLVDHGPGGGRCSALHRWARARGSSAVGRRGLGLFGARAGAAPSPTTGRRSAWAPAAGRGPPRRS